MAGTGSWKDVDLSGKVAVVTGSNDGLGLEVAKQIAERGARVVMACRNQDKAAAAAEQVRAKASAPVDVVKLDLASLASVADCAKGILDTEDRLDLLLNNAGLMAIDKGTTEDGFEMQFGVNHLGHFAFTAHLSPRLLSTPGARVVNMSSYGHRPGRLHLDDLMFERRGYDRWRPYFQSKLANLLFTAEHQRRLTEAGQSMLALASHPGTSRTDLGVEGTGVLNKLLKPGQAVAGQPASLGAQPMVRAATDPSAKGGQFYGPMFLTRGAPKLEKPSKQARNAADAKALWTKSEELTGVEFSIPKAG
jgi:NAD(P)-dependent dehydrogenase (short-subunit alcohol dehydrogenase family)